LEYHSLRDRLVPADRAISLIVRCSNYMTIGTIDGEGRNPKTLNLFDVLHGSHAVPPSPADRIACRVTPQALLPGTVI